MKALSRLAQVNAALKSLGAAERLHRGHDYYYFAGGSAAMWPESGVYVARADQLSVDAWLVVYNELKQEAA